MDNKAHLWRAWWKEQVEPKIYVVGIHRGLGQVRDCGAHRHVLDEPVRVHAHQAEECVPKFVRADSAGSGSEAGGVVDK